MSTFIHSLRGEMSTPLYELGGKCPHMQFLGRGQMSEGANVRLPQNSEWKSSKLLHFTHVSTKCLKYVHI